MPLPTALGRPHLPSLLSRLSRQTLPLLPGLALVSLVSAAALTLKRLLGLDGLSPMMIGMAIGALLCNLLPLPAVTAPGIRFAAKALLRLSVALLGLQITLGQITGSGPWGLAITAVTLFSTFGFCLLAGRLLGIGRDLTTLIAAGTSVCGAAAIAGVNSAISAKEEEVAYAISSITLFGCLGMIAAPLLAPLLGLDAAVYGTWVGLSLHEVAQAVGAGFQGGEVAGQTAVIAKLSRVILLAPLILLILTLRRSSALPHPAGQKPALLPWFVTLFLVLCGIHSAGLIPAAISAPALTATPLMMTAALSALGLGTSFKRLSALGPKPMLLCAAGSVFISGLSLLLLGLAP